MQNATTTKPLTPNKNDLVINKNNSSVGGSKKYLFAFLL